MNFRVHPLNANRCGNDYPDTFILWFIIYFLDNIFDYPDTSVIIRKCPINPKILSSSPNSARLNGLT